jgi:hypothetical protein
MYGTLHAQISFLFVNPLDKEPQLRDKENKLRDKKNLLCARSADTEGKWKTIHHLPPTLALTTVTVEVGVEKTRRYD